MSQCDLLIKNGKILTADGTIETGKSIAIKDSIILDVTEHPDTYTAVSYTHLDVYKRQG